MPSKPDWHLAAEAIIKEHGGKMYFNFGEVSKIIGCGIHTVPRLFYDAGIAVKKVGPSKRVSAYDIATVMTSGRTSAVG